MHIFEHQSGTLCCLALVSVFFFFMVEHEQASDCATKIQSLRLKWWCERKVRLIVLLVIGLRLQKRSITANVLLFSFKPNNKYAKVLQHPNQTSVLDILTSCSMNVLGEYGLVIQSGCFQQCLGDGSPFWTPSLFETPI